MTWERVGAEELEVLLSMEELLATLRHLEGGAHIILEIHRFMVLEAILVRIQVLEPQILGQAALAELRQVH
jgi:hypothetical protein